MVDVEATLARNRERLDRLSDGGAGPLGAFRLRALPVGRWADAVLRRLARMVGGAAAVALIAFFWGMFVRPIGFSGVAVTVLAMVAVFLLLGVWPPPRRIRPDRLAATPLPRLGADVGAWLEQQRGALPPGARRQLDRIRARLAQLGPHLGAAAPAAGVSPTDAAEVQRLLSVHLPRLLQSYEAVPENLRDAPEAERQLGDGLATIADELDRIGAKLGRDRLDALETEGRFLESRYGERPADG